MRHSTAKVLAAILEEPMSTRQRLELECALVRAMAGARIDAMAPRRLMAGPVERQGLTGRPDPLQRA